MLLSRLWNLVPNPRIWVAAPWILGGMLGGLGFFATLDLPLIAAAAIWSAALAAGVALAFRGEPLLVETGTPAAETKKQEPPPPPPPSLLDLVPIEGDRFRMGSPPATEAELKEYIAEGWSEASARDWRAREEPAHQVRVSSFAIARVPLTRGQWRSVMPEAPDAWKGDGSDDHLPATHLDWTQALAVCNALSKRERLAPCYQKDPEGRWRWEQNADGYRLPTEAEWEYACRAGTRDRWFWGDDPKDAEAYAWFSGNSETELHPVGRKSPNPWGLHDMSGLVYEWCWDRFGAYPEGTDTPAADPEGPSEGGTRVIRGGSFFNPPGILRSANRDDFRPDIRDDYLGLRCVRSRVRQQAIPDRCLAGPVGASPRTPARLFQ